MNEKEMIDYINAGNYTANFIKFLKQAFPNFDNTKQVKAEKLHDGIGNIKPDIKISHNGVIVYISHKDGSGNSVHQESCYEFFNSMSLVISEDFINILRLYHFGDKTLDGTGLQRYDANDLKKIYKEEIQNLNSVINTKDVLNYAIDKFLAIGNLKSDCKVDFVYYGNPELDGTWASISELKEYFSSNIFVKKEVHFGPMTYQVWGRNQNFTAKNPERRYVMQIKWSSIKNDLNAIRRL